MSDGYRKAALALSSLAPRDRRWMLSQLDPDQRTRVDALLGELSALGLQADAASAAPLWQEPLAAPVAAAARVDPRAMLEVLADEPDWMMALVLRLRPGPWREPFLALLGAARCARLQRALPPGMEVAPKAREALLACIERRLEEQALFAARMPAPPEPRFWQRRLSWRR